MPVSTSTTARAARPSLNLSREIAASFVPTQMCPARQSRLAMIAASASTLPPPAESKKAAPSQSGLSKFLKRTLSLALGELEAPAGFRTAVLFTFNNTAVTGQEAA